MVLSSATTMALERDPSHPTGYFADEVIKPFDEFVQAGLEVAVATPDGRVPSADPYGLEPFFHYLDDDEDFLAGVIRTFAPDSDDIRVTLHQLTELDLIAARRLHQEMVRLGVVPESARRLIDEAAREAWRADRSLVDVLSEGGASGIDRERIEELAREARTDAAAAAAEMERRLSSVEALQRPLDLGQMSEADMATYDAVFFPGGHAPMADLADDPRVRRLLHTMHEQDRTISSVCHGVAALLSAGDGPEGRWLFDGYRMTGFTDEEEDQTTYGKLGLPWYVESALKNRGAVFDDGDAAWVSHVVVDRNLVTGQNPVASKATAEAVIKSVLGRAQ